MTLKIEITGCGREQAMDFVTPKGKSRESVFAEVHGASGELSKDPSGAKEYAYGLDSWTVIIKDGEDNELGSFSGTADGNCPECKVNDGEYAIKYETSEVGTFATGEIEIDDDLSGCRSLKCVKLPMGFKKAEVNLFNGCESIEMIEFPYGTEEVVQDVFKDCVSLREVVFPANFNPDSLWPNVFTGCTALEKIVFRCHRPADFDDPAYPESEYISDHFPDSLNVKTIFA